MSLSFLLVPTTVATSSIFVLKTHLRKGSWVAGHVLSKGTQRQGLQEVDTQSLSSVGIIGGITGCRAQGHLLLSVHLHPVYLDNKGQSSAGLCAQVVPLPWLAPCGLFSSKTSAPVRPLGSPSQSGSWPSYPGVGPLPHVSVTGFGPDPSLYDSPECSSAQNQLYPTQS